jgi:N-acetylglucosamine-6-phosphate deacetylase
MPDLELINALTGRPAVMPVDCLRAARPDERLYVSPGWIDIQVNGFAGLDLNGPQLDAATVAGITRRLFVEGVAAWCPTLITAPLERLEHAMAAIAQACEQDPLARACVAGIHLEGPFISPLDGARGAHPREHVILPDWDAFQRLQRAAGGRIRILTLAPEQPGALELISRLAQSGVIPAIGHSAAGPGVVHAAVQAGARLSTHLGNGIAATINRHNNPIWDQLAEDALYAGLIFDGFHLPPALMKVMLRAKNTRRCLLVSDATAMARMAPGIYETEVGGKVELAPNGRLGLYGTEYLAGSASSLKDGLKTALRLAGARLADAVRMVTTNPAHLLGWRSHAQTVFAVGPDGQIDVRAVLVKGKIVLGPIPPGPPSLEGEKISKN